MSASGTADVDVDVVVPGGGDAGGVAIHVVEGDRVVEAVDVGCGEPQINAGPRYARGSGWARGERGG